MKDDWRPQNGYSKERNNKERERRDKTWGSDRKRKTNDAPLEWR